jgi:peptidoglycan/xylan/chitin deacetylase (PgdA/CDA1 family)
MNLRGVYGRISRFGLCTMHRRMADLSLQQPTVTFCFDDFPRTALTQAGALLSRAGCHGTYYAAAALVNTHTALGEQFTRQDLIDLLAAGHELASHTFHHISGRSVPYATFATDVSEGWLALTELAGSPASRNFAYPYGDLTLKTKQGLASVMTTCRGIYDGLNGPRVDLGLLRACSLYGGTERSHHAQQFILAAKRCKKWLIFYTHDVTSQPSRFGCTPDLFESTLSFALRHGMRVLSIQEVVAAGLPTACSIESGRES